MLFSSFFIQINLLKPEIISSLTLSPKSFIWCQSPNFINSMLINTKFPYFPLYYCSLLSLGSYMSYLSHYNYSGKIYKTKPQLNWIIVSLNIIYFHELSFFSTWSKLLFQSILKSLCFYLPPLLNGTLHNGKNLVSFVCILGNNHNTCIL